MIEFVLSPLTSCPLSYWHHGTVTARAPILLLLLLSGCWSRREKGLRFCCLPVPHIDSPLSHLCPLSFGTAQIDPSAVSPRYHHGCLLPATTHSALQTHTNISPQKLAILSTCLSWSVNSLRNPELPFKALPMPICKTPQIYNLLT